MNKYAKCIVAGLSVAIAAATPLVSDNSLSIQDVLIVLGAGLAGAFPTWAIPNEPAE